jgi:HTH-type transcriptional regulator / antitoxin HipB
VSKSINSFVVGAVVRRARLAAGLSQTDLGRRIGASRFWVAQFEKGKPSAEIGLALQALHALGLVIRIEPKNASLQSTRHKATLKTGRTILARVIARTTLKSAPPSSVIGWPTASATLRRVRKS